MEMIQVRKDGDFRVRTVRSNVREKNIKRGSVIGICPPEADKFESVRVGSVGMHANRRVFDVESNR